MSNETIKEEEQNGATASAKIFCLNSTTIHRQENESEPHTRHMQINQPTQSNHTEEAGAAWKETAHRARQ